MSKVNIELSVNPSPSVTTNLSSLIFTNLIPIHNLRGYNFE